MYGCTEMYGYVRISKKVPKNVRIVRIFFVCTEMYGFHVKSLKIVILANCHVVAIKILACML